MTSGKKELAYSYTPLKKIIWNVLALRVKYTMVFNIPQYLTTNVFEQCLLPVPRKTTQKCDGKSFTELGVS